MSTVNVEVVSISSIIPHPNADKLELALVKGWQVVVQKGKFQVGDLAIYFPIDCVLPNEIEEKLFGPESKVKLTKGRIKTIRLRGAVSQGLLAPIASLFYLPDVYAEGDILTDQLGVTKYEPAPPPFEGFNGSGQSKTKITHPLFYKYSGIENFKNFVRYFNEDDQIVVSEKTHGCLQANTLIHFADGTRKTIQEVVAQKLEGPVLALSPDGLLIESKITNWFDNGLTHDWKKLKFTRAKIDRGNHFGTVACTSNHKFWNPEIKTFVKCQDIKVGDKVLSIRNEIIIPYTQQQVMIGKMLGDGSLSANCITFGHRMEHEEYLEYTLKCLAHFAGNRQTNQLSGYGTEMCRARTISCHPIKNLFQDWISSGQKQVPANIDLGPIALAFWYMDDGSLNHHEDQEDRAGFATCAFDENSINILINAFHKLNIMAKKYFSNGYWRIRLNSDAADRMFTLISPFVPNIMQYKLPKRFRKSIKDELSWVCEPTYKKTFVPQIVLAIEDLTVNMNKHKFDIETEHHNFIANGVVVHNSNARATVQPFYPKTWWQKILRFFRLTPQTEFLVGSHNTERDPNHPTDIYAEMARRLKLKEKLKVGQIMYGEIYGPNIQKGYHYGVPQGQTEFVCFDISQDGQYLSHDEVQKICDELQIKTAPVLYRGLFKDANLKELSQGPSVLCPDQPVREGIVIKSDKTSYRKVLKYINDDYLLLKDTTDYH